MDLSLITVLLGGSGLVFAGLAVARLRERRILRAGSHLLFGAVSGALAVALAAVAANLHTYGRLTYERDVAQLGFESLAPRRFRVTVAFADGDSTQVYELSGDEWQIDARMLKWSGVANLLGLDANYRLDRLGGRYGDLTSEREAARTVYALSDNPGLDLWALAQRYERWLPFADASYGSAAYLPMADGARFVVTITQVGIIARADNEAAQTAVTSWR